MLATALNLKIKILIIMPSKGRIGFIRPLFTPSVLSVDFT